MKPWNKKNVIMNNVVRWESWSA